MELGKLGMVTVGDTSTYQPWSNPLLQQGVMGLSLWGATPMNPGTFATPPAAAALAGALGGAVVDDPMAANWRVTARALAVKTAGAVVNAGAICGILGNDAAWANERSKSWEICELLGVPFDAGMADRLYRSLAAEIR